MSAKPTLMCTNMIHEILEIAQGQNIWPYSKLFCLHPALNIAFFSVSWFVAENSQDIGGEDWAAKFCHRRSFCSAARRWSSQWNCSKFGWNRSFHMTPHLFESLTWSRTRYIFYAIRCKNFLSTHYYIEDENQKAWLSAECPFGHETVSAVSLAIVHSSPGTTSVLWKSNSFRGSFILSSHDQALILSYYHITGFISLNITRLASELPGREKVIHLLNYWASGPNHVFHLHHISYQARRWLGHLKKDRVRRWQKTKVCQMQWRTCSKIFTQFLCDVWLATISNHVDFKLIDKKWEWESDGINEII